MTLGKLLKFSACVALSTIFAAAPAFAGANDDCVKTNTSGLPTIQQLYKRYGIDDDHPCPEQSRFDDAKNCRTKAKELDGIENDWKNIQQEKCTIAGKMRALPTCAKQAACQDDSKRLNADAANVNRRELAALSRLKSKLKEIKKMQLDIAEGAKNVQEHIEQGASTNANGKDEHVDKLARARGAGYRNFADAKNFFQDSLSTVSQAIEQARNGHADPSQLNTPLSREPIAVAAAADDYEAAIDKRMELVKSQGEAYTMHENVADTRGQNLDEINKKDGAGGSGNGSGDGKGSDSSSGLGDASKMAQAASGLGGGGGSGGGNAASQSPDMSSLGGNTPSFNPSDFASNSSSPSSGTGTTPYSPTSGGASPGSSGAGNTKLASANPTATNTNTNATYVPNSVAPLVSSTGTVGSGNGSSPNAASRTLDPNAGITAMAANPSNTSGASSNPARSSALRDALKARLASQGGGGEGGSTGFTSSGASMSPGLGSGGASSGALPSSLLPVLNSPASDNVLDAASGSTGGDLGNTDFSLAGSDTDAAVKGMLKDFGVDDHHDGRAPASTGGASMSAPEILSADSASLFMRTRETHQRSLKKGLVINGLRAKL